VKEPIMTLVSPRTDYVPPSMEVVQSCEVKMINGRQTKGK